ncbi:MAG: bifunctional NAD(P)H-hydrate repair enzyme Nnr [Nitrospinaceae bacterium]|nr:MAG: bifunctional NAD(P)H-hydrate repair enzyme Nnr [Nitrospinaceae bacterium]
MQTILTAAEMQAIDKRSIEKFDIPGAILMENAGRGAVDVLKNESPDLMTKRIVVFAGKGNNGGDGFVMARHLFNMGTDVLVLLLGKISELKADARLNAGIAKNIGVEINEVDAANFKSFDHRLRHSDLIIDAIFGTGLTQPASGFFADVFEKINQLQKCVVSVDIPSGVDSDSGQLIGPHVKADRTLALALLKRSHVTFPAASVMGDIARIDIGIPEKAVAAQTCTVQMTESGDIAQGFKKRPEDAHKGDFGHVLVVAGSLGKGGAAGLTALGALRAGCGLVTLALPESCQKTVEFNPLEAMTVPLPETSNGTLAPAAKDLILEHARGKSSVAVGPGISTDPETIRLLQSVLPDIELPMVLDADAVNGLAESGALKSLKNPELILTPHPKEMSRISGLSTREIQSNRIETACRFARENGIHLVLKGARSIIAFPDGSVFINPTGNPGMATAGSGDVLTGIIAGLIAQKMEIRQAVIAGTYLHGLAGDIFTEKAPEASLIASDLVNNLPESLNRVLS